MQEQQGSLMPKLSRLPGPRPFKKGKSKMENNITNGTPAHEDGKPDWSKPVDATVDEIVARTAEAIAKGKAFGGWTDKVEESAAQGATIQQLDELPFLAPIAGVIGRVAASAIGKKALKGAATQAAGSLVGKALGKTRQPQHDPNQQ